MVFFIESVARREIEGGEQLKKERPNEGSLHWAGFL